MIRPSTILYIEQLTKNHKYKALKPRSLIKLGPILLDLQVGKQLAISRCSKYNITQIA